MLAVVSDVSIIVPIKNGSRWIKSFVDSVLNLETNGIKTEVSIFNDGSTDNTAQLLQTICIPQFAARGIPTVITGDPHPHGAGYAKNRAVQQSNGRFLCFMDVDDVTLPLRVKRQWETIRKARNPDLTIVGARFTREPVDSTGRYTRWANQLTPEQLRLQIYTSHGPTLIAPTWFLSRRLFDALNGFDETNPIGFPEDYDFFLRAIDLGTEMIRVNESLVIYRYHNACASFGVPEETIWRMRLAALENRVLAGWQEFTIWNAGKQVRRLYRSLTDENRKKVIAFCDVDEKKLKQGWYECFDEKTRTISARIPIRSLQSVVPPFIICVKLDMTNGDLENYLANQKSWMEGREYVHFS